MIVRPNKHKPAGLEEKGRFGWKLTINQGAFMRGGMSQRETLAESFVQILAGSDTTAIVIRTTLLHAITSPKVYQRLKQEIKAAGVDRLSPIGNEQAKDLVYFQVSTPSQGLTPCIPLASYVLLLCNDRSTRCAQADSHSLPTTPGCHVGGIPDAPAPALRPIQGSPAGRYHPLRRPPARWHCGRRQPHRHDAARRHIRPGRAPVPPRAVPRVR